MKTLNEFLDSFCSILNDRYADGFTYNKLMDDVRYKRLPLVDREVADVEPLSFEYLDKLRTVIDSLVSISKAPKFELKQEYDTRRREQVTKVDVQSIRETNKKQSYWGVDDFDGVSPNKMVSTVNEISYGTYENRFVVMLIEQLLQFVNRQINGLVARIDYIGGNFINAQTTYCDAKEINKLIRFRTFKKKSLVSKRITKPVLIKGESELEQPLSALLKIRATLFNLMNSQFYKDVKRAPAFRESSIRKTNVFNDEHNYRNCFEFYREFRMMRKRVPVCSPVNRNFYRDYVVVKLFRALKDLGFKFDNSKQKLVKKHIFLKDFEGLSKDRVYCRINTLQNDIEIDFEVRYLKGQFHKTAGLNERRTSKVSLLLNPTPTENLSKDEYQEYLKGVVDRKILKGFDNAFTVIPDVGVLRDDIIVASPASEKPNNNLVNALASCLIFVEANQNIYSRICPVCGNKINSVGEEGTYHCPVCESSYAFLVTGSKKVYQTTLWIKRIKTIE